MPGDFRPRVESAIRRLRPGEVASYGDLAAEAGYPGAARGVGAILAHSEDLPWWRVVNVKGRLVHGKEVEQARRLVEEGVAVVDGQVALSSMAATLRPPLPARLRP